MKQIGKKGSIMEGVNGLTTLAVGLFIAGIVMTFLALVNTNIKTQLTSGTIEYGILGNASLAGAAMASFLSPVAYVGIAVVIIGMIVGGFAMNR